MKKDRNANVLRQIRSDINQWRAGGFPPGKRIFLFVWGLHAFGGFWLAMNSSVGPTVSALIFTLSSVIGLIIARAVTATIPKTWSEALDKRLSSYQPKNQVAWNYLQKTAREKGKLEVHDLERWYESEAITVSPKVKKPLRFLNNQPETKDTESLK
ncbi:hypothetical protein AW40_27140 [Kosakonia radicincitans UMEnt01/12]|uniref:hypothetical protein n=1 Tax=Kosakonia radicincitans TaxID=283686 RepID=UPI0004618F3C|nr:hypothetical protein [Kosakonia radicincitans]KDE33558.1 hypothetical protein AW40_27140 [Kosakonia radicincitans UMEnt01/12]